MLSAQLAGAASTNETLATSDFSQKADDYLKTELNSERFAGSVMVARSNQIVFMKGYGLANRELEVANAPDTKFRLASITKQFTALCILILQEQGKLSVEDPVSKYLTNCPNAWSKIKIRHLLTHTSGIPDYTRFPDYRSTEMLPWPPEKMMDSLAGQAPGIRAGRAVRLQQLGLFSVEQHHRKGGGPELRAISGAVHFPAARHDEQRLLSISRRFCPIAPPVIRGTATRG